MNVQDSDVRVTFRVDKDLKEQADMLFARLGLNMTTALNVFLRKSVNESAIPFAVSERKTGFGMGLSADDISKAFSSAVRNEIEEHGREGFPVARYDMSNKRAYLEMADGKREYIGE